MATRHWEAKRIEASRAASTTHGMARRENPDPMYVVWCGIVQRCENPAHAAYPRYGGRGITICTRWRRDFMAFYEDMGPRPTPGYSVDRIDNDGPYSPENCRWATAKEQNRNCRTNRMLTFQGETLCLAEWSERTGIKQTTLLQRLDRSGWSVERALTAPIRRKAVSWQ